MQLWFKGVPMNFTPTPISGAYVISLTPYVDGRGYFARMWCEQEFSDHGLHARMVQSNVSVSRRRGTIRGIHFQRAPHEEAKLVRCARGAIYDVVVDLRPNSATFRQWHAVHLEAGDQRICYVPEGCGHGFQTLLDESEVNYLTSACYAPQHSAGVRYNDPAFGIEWPLPVTNLSPADTQWPAFDDAPNPDPLQLRS